MLFVLIPNHGMVLYVHGRCWVPVPFMTRGCGAVWMKGVALIGL